MGCQDEFGKYVQSNPFPLAIFPDIFYDAIWIEQGRFGRGREDWGMKRVEDHRQLSAADRIAALSRMVLG
jgi:hypothetical protein